MGDDGRGTRFAKLETQATRGTRMVHACDVVAEHGARVTPLAQLVCGMQPLAHARRLADQLARANGSSGSSLVTTGCGAGKATMLLTMAAVGAACWR